MLQEAFLLFSKLSFLFGGELPFVLIFLDRYQILVANLDFLLQQVLDVALGELDVSGTLCDDKISVFVSIPSLRHRHLACFEAHVNQILFEGKFADLRRDQHALFLLADRLQSERTFCFDNFFLDQLVFGLYLELGLLKFLKLSDSLVQQGFSHLGILGSFCVFDVQNDELVGRLRVSPVQVCLQVELLEKEAQGFVVGS